MNKYAIYFSFEEYIFVFQKLFILIRMSEIKYLLNNFSLIKKLLIFY